MAEAAHYGTQLGGGDLAVAVNVEFLEDLFEFFLDPGAGTLGGGTRQYGWIHGGGGEGDRDALFFVFAIEQGF